MTSFPKTLFYFYLTFYGLAAGFNGNRYFTFFLRLDQTFAGNSCDLLIGRFKGYLLLSRDRCCHRFQFKALTLLQNKILLVKCQLRSFNCRLLYIDTYFGSLSAL